jgi:hypothetical protein
VDATRAIETTDIRNVSVLGLRNANSLPRATLKHKMSGPAENGPSSEIARHLVTARHAAKDLLLVTVRRVAKAEALLIALRVVIVLRVRMVTVRRVAKAEALLIALRVVIVLRVRMVIGHRVVKVIVHRVVNAPHSVTGHLERKGEALAVVHPEATSRHLVTGLQEEIAHRVLKEEVSEAVHLVKKVIVRHAVIVPHSVTGHLERKGVALAVVHPEATDRRLVTGLQEEIVHRVLKEEEVLGVAHRVQKVIVRHAVIALHSVTGHLERKGVALAVVHPEATDRRLVTGLQEEIAHRVLREEEVLGVAHRVQKVMVRHAVIVPRLVIVHQEVIVPPEATRGRHAVIAQALATVRREVIVLREAPNVQPAEGQMAEVAIHEDHGVLPEADAVLVHRPEFMKELTRL